MQQPPPQMACVSAAVSAIPLLRSMPRQVLENAWGARRHGRRKLLGRIKRQLRWACEWSTHQYYGPEHVGPDDCAIGRYRRTEVMPDHSGHGAVAKRRDQTQRVPDKVRQANLIKVAVIRVIPPHSASIAALIGATT